MKNFCLGVDLGSVSTDMVLIDESKNVYKKVYLRTFGKPVDSVHRGLKELFRGEKDICVIGAGATGSGRKIAAQMIGADIIKNEITAHAVAAAQVCPQVSTVMEIGGQDSKIIFLNDGVVTDFNMNTVCAAGTGSFLDRQAERLGINISQMGSLALKSISPTPIAGRCAVFAESDMIHKQQEGNSTNDILAGLCASLVRNYLNNLAPGRKLLPPILFQGGVAANKGIVAAFEREIGCDIIVPENHDVMGAWGAAILALEKIASGAKTRFRGTQNLDGNWQSRPVICKGCSNGCHVAVICLNDKPVGFVGNRCDGFLRTIKAANPTQTR